MSSVDVIVPCYRYGHFLRECVESVLTQDGPDVRVLIIDDASPDNTADVAAELVHEDSRVSFVRHAKNKGHIATYNEGIEWASSDYLLVLSADDYLLPGSLSRAAKLMDAFPEVGFTFGKVIPLNSNDTLRKTEFEAGEAGWRILKGLEFIELNGVRNMVATASAVVRTKLQKSLGGYRSDLPHSGDMEMWLRFAANASVGIVEAYQAVYRKHSDNMSLKYQAKNWLPDVQQRKAALDCFFQSYGRTLPEGQRLQNGFLRLLGCHAIELASTAFNEGDMEVSGQLSEFAVRICPGVKGSLPWMRLVCKRLMGYRAWHALQPVVKSMRQAESSLRRLISRPS